MRVGVLGCACVDTTQSTDFARHDGNNHTNHPITVMPSTVSHRDVFLPDPRIIVRARCLTTARFLRLHTDSLQESTWRFYLTGFAQGPVEILSARPCVNPSEPLLRWEQP